MLYKKHVELSDKIQMLYINHVQLSDKIWMMYKKHVDWLARTLYRLMAWRLDTGTICAQIQVDMTNSCCGEGNCARVSFTEIIDGKFELLTSIDNTIRPPPSGLLHLTRSVRY
jgi:hypothetical protein